MQTAPAVVTSINPDTRPLPPGWTSYVDQTGSWYYVNTSSAPPQFTYNRPLGPDPVQKVPNNVQMTNDRQIDAFTLSPHSVSTSVLGPASLPPGAALPTPPRPYAYSTGIMSVSHSSESANQQPQQPVLAQASVTYTDQTPVQKQPMPTAAPVYVQNPPPHQTTRTGFLDAPKDVAYVPAVPYPMEPGYTVLVPLRKSNPNSPQPTTYEPLTADVAGRRIESTMQTFKNFSKVALDIAETTIKAATIVQNVSTEAMSMLGNIFSSNDVANNLSVVC